MSKVKPIPPEIVDYLDYNPETGVSTWKKKPSSQSRIKIGQEAGRIDNRGYRRVKFKKRDYASHRLAYFIYHGVDPLEKQIDHIDGNPLNNKIDNLRPVTNSQNQMNRGFQSNNKSGIIGVYWHKGIKKWESYINVKKKKKNLGYFDDIEEAKAARIAAEKKYFGEFRNDCNEKILEDLGKNNG